MRIDPTIIAPLGEQISQLCEELPLDLCGVLPPTDPADRSGVWW